MKMFRITKKSTFFVSIFAISIGSLLYQSYVDNQEKKREIAKYKVLVSTYEQRGKLCVPVKDLPVIDFANNVRSEARVLSVATYFAAIGKAKCFLRDEKTIFTNPYRSFSIANVGEADIGSPEYEIWQGMLFYIDFGMPFLRTGGSVCADGSFSPSVGRGTCSWHGGYGSHRGELFNFKLSKPIYDPRPRLARLESS